MAQVHTLTSSFSGSGVSYTKAEAPSGNSVLVFDQSVPIGTNTPYLFAIDRSQLLSMSMTASTDVTIKTNSSGSPTDTIVLEAGQVYNWSLTRDGLTAGPGLVTCPISADVTAGFFITNAAISVIKIVCLSAN